MKGIELRNEEMKRREDDEDERECVDENILEVTTVTTQHQETIMENEPHVFDIKTKKETIQREIKRRKEELKDEEKTRLKKVEDELLRKEEFENEFNDEIRGERKFSEEEREFRKQREQERETKLIELINKMEFDRINLQSEFENQLKTKDDMHEMEMYEKEKILFSKLKKIEERSLKEMEDLAKAKESKVLSKLEEVEDDKRREWDKLEEDSLEKLQSEGNKYLRNLKLVQSDCGNNRNKRMKDMEKRRDELNQNECGNVFDGQKEYLMKLQREVKETIVEEAKQIALQEEANRRKQLQGDEEKLWKKLEKEESNFRRKLEKLRYDHSEKLSREEREFHHKLEREEVDRKKKLTKEETDVQMKIEKAECDLKRKVEKEESDLQKKLEKHEIDFQKKLESDETYHKQKLERELTSHKKQLEIEKQQHFNFIFDEETKRKEKMVENETKLKEQKKLDEMEIRLKVDELKKEEEEIGRRLKTIESIHHEGSSKRYKFDEMEKHLKEKEDEINKRFLQIEENAKMKNELKMGEGQFDLCSERGENLKMERKKIAEDIKKEYEKRFEELERNYEHKENELEMKLLNISGEQNEATTTTSKRRDVEFELLESQREVGIYKEKASVLELIGREMQYDMEEMHKMIEVLNHTHKDKDERRSQMEYKLAKECEEKNVFEKLHSQLREQLIVMERKVNSESELRRLHELGSQKLQNEIQSRDEKLRKIETEMQELRSSLKIERQTKLLQDNRYEDQVRQHEHALKEMEKTSSHLVETVRKLEVVDESRRKAENTVHKLNVELAQVKNELSRTQCVLDEVRSSIGGQLTKVTEKLEEKMEKLVTCERNLVQSQLQHEHEKLNRSSLEEKLTKTVQVESKVQQNYEDEVNSVKQQLQKCQVELRHLKSSTSSQLHAPQPTLFKTRNDKNHLERELEVGMEKIKVVEEKLCKSESKIQMIRDEMTCERDLFKLQAEQNEKGKLRTTSLENKNLNNVHLKSTVQNNSKMTDAGESAVQEKFEEEVNSLKQQLEKCKAELRHLNNKLSGVDHGRDSTPLKVSNDEKREGTVSTDRLKVFEGKLSSSEGEMQMLKDELHSLKQQLEKCKVQLYNDLSGGVESTTLKTSNDKNVVERDLAVTMEKLKVVEEKLSHTETEIQMLKDEVMTAGSGVRETKKGSEFNHLEETNNNKRNAKEQNDKLMHENSDLKAALGNYQTQVSTLTSEKKDLETNVNHLKSDLEKVKGGSSEMTEMLQRKMSEIEKTRLENQKIQSSLQEIKQTKSFVEGELREEKARAEIIQVELSEASKARESLEALLANIKGNNLNLEEKLNSETFIRLQHEKELEEHKGMCELEAKSRSKISRQVLELEKQLEQLTNQLEEEKRKSRKLVEQKKSADSKNEIYEKRSVQHQQEVSSLRNKLKLYQRRLKECEANDSRIPALNAEFELERQATSANMSKLRRQIDQLTDQLSREQEMREGEEKKSREQLKELTDIKTNGKVQAYEQERLERKCREFQLELERQKEYYERNFCPAEEIEEFKKALETKARLDLNKKLQEVNMHLEEQLMAREAFDKLRSGIERKTKTGFETTVSQLKNDLTEVKASLHEGLVNRDTSIMEAQRFKELFEGERNNSGRLADELVKTTEMLSFERNRTNYLFDETVNKSKVTKKLFEESLQKDKRNSISPRLDDIGLNSSFYPSKLWNVPPVSTPKDKYTNISPIKRRSLLS